MPERESHPGPWRVVKDPHGWAVRDADYWLIAHTTKKIEADRMAAAPEMLEVLSIFVDCYPAQIEPLKQRARHLIAKVSGETDA